MAKSKNGYVTKAYLLDGARYRRDGAKPIEVVESFLVEGINSDRVDGWSQHVATEALGIPGLWDLHPLSESDRIEDRLRAVSYMTRFVGTDKAIVEVRYENIGPFIEYRGGNILQVVDADTAWPANTQDTYPNPPPARESIILAKQSGSSWLYQAGRAYAEIPILSVTQTQIALASTFTGSISDPTTRVNPFQLSMKYVGKINYDIVKICNVDCQPGTLKCTNISYDNENLGDLAWKLSVEIAYNPLSWHTEVCYLDQNGLPDTSASTRVISSRTPDAPGNSLKVGRKLVQTCLMAKFSDLLNLV